MDGQKTSAARILQRVGVWSKQPRPNSTSDNSIEELISTGHRYLHFLSPSAAPCYPAAADFRWGCHLPALCSAHRSYVEKKQIVGSALNSFCWNLLLLVWLFFSAMEKSRILKTFLLFLQICRSFPWIHEWYKAARTVNSSHSLAAQWAVKSCWSH